MRIEKNKTVLLTEIQSLWVKNLYILHNMSQKPPHFFNFWIYKLAESTMLLCFSITHGLEN